MHKISFGWFLSSISIKVEKREDTWKVCQDSCLVSQLFNPSERPLQWIRVRVTTWEMSHRTSWFHGLITVTNRNSSSIRKPRKTCALLQPLMLQTPIQARNLTTYCFNCFTSQTFMTLPCRPGERITSVQSSHRSTGSLCFKELTLKWNAGQLFVYKALTGLGSA